MTLHVILFILALLIGMALSVAAFGTGSKRKRIFQDIYFSIEDTDGIGVLYTKTGEYSAILAMENPVQKYSANADSYYEFSHLFNAIVQTLGEGYALHKQDIFTKKRFSVEDANSREFLSTAYFAISRDVPLRTVSPASPSLRRAKRAVCSPLTARNGRISLSRYVRYRTV